MVPSLGVAAGTVADTDSVSAVGCRIAEALKGVLRLNPARFHYHVETRSRVALVALAHGAGKADSGGPSAM